MNKLLLCGALFMGLSANSQTTLFQDNFESGAGNWTLNGGTGDNQWIVNNVFASGFTPFIMDTPGQPGAVTNSPNSAYLHIYSNMTCSFASVCNATFDAASAANRTVQSANPIVTTSYNTVTLSFYYLAAGDAAEAYGTLEYSTDNVNWIPTGTHYVGVSTWTLESVSLPAWDNQAQLKFRFRWFNTDAEIGDDPAFSIDEVKVTGIPAVSASVSTGAITSTVFCSDNTGNVSVPFTVTGTVNPANVYTARLSDGTGSFASPTTIGTLTSSATGNLTIPTIIPSGLAAGTGYRIRVDATAPIIVGTDNGTDITIADPPSLVINSMPADGIICAGSSASLTVSGGAIFTWSPSGSLDNATAQTVTATPASTQTYSVIGTAVNGCSGTATFMVTVDDCAGLEEESFGDFELYPNPANQELNLNFGELKGIQALSILDLAGRIVLSTTNTSSKIDLSSLESGKYFLIVAHEAGNAVKSFLKQ